MSVDDILDLGCTSGCNKCRVVRWNSLDDVGDQFVGEDVLRNGDEEGASEDLNEHHDCRSGGNIINMENCLNGHKRLLEAHSGSKAEDDLIPNPHRMTSRGGEGGQEACSYGHENRRSNHERCVVTQQGDRHTGNNRQENLGKDQREVIDARLRGCG